MLAKIRDFFAQKNILEVETPLLSHATNPAPHLDSFACNDLYLQTSPEFAMKRLLAANSGDVYQICKAFRRNESGRLHNPEFTILEWYRVNFDHHNLMNEMDSFLNWTVNTPKALRLTYKEIFEEFLKINPHTEDIAQLKAIAGENNLNVPSLNDDTDGWLQLLFTHLIEPKLLFPEPIFVYDFPASQGMLARVRKESPPVASRFEVYFKGIELANGFHELNDAEEQHKRFVEDLKLRAELNLSQVPLDENFLSSLQTLPNCSGVAVGIDRLLLLAANKAALKEVVCFMFDDA